MPIYRIVEFHPGGRVSAETFEAPGDDEAWSRAADVAESEEMELWRGEVLIRSTRD